MVLEVEGHLAATVTARQDGIGAALGYHTRARRDRWTTMRRQGSPLRRVRNGAGCRLPRHSGSAHTLNAKQRPVRLNDSAMAAPSAQQAVTTDGVPVAVRAHRPRR